MVGCLVTYSDVIMYSNTCTRIRVNMPMQQYLVQFTHGTGWKVTVPQGGYREGTIRIESDEATQP